MFRDHETPPLWDARAYETALRHDRIAQIESRLKTPLPPGLKDLLRRFARSRDDGRDHIHRLYDLSRPFASRRGDDPVGFEWAVWLGTVAWQGRQDSATSIGPGDPLVARILDACPRTGSGTLHVHLDAPDRTVPPVAGDRAILPLRIAAESMTFHATRRGDAFTAVAVWPLAARPTPVFPHWNDVADALWVEPLSGPQEAFALAVLFELSGWQVAPTHLSSGQRGLCLSRGERVIVVAPDGQVGVSGGSRPETAEEISATRAAMPRDGIIRQLRWPAPAATPATPRHLDADGVLWCEP